MNNRHRGNDIQIKNLENPEERGPPLKLPRACNDLVLRKIASKSKLTACIDMSGAASLCEWRLAISDLLAMAILILEVTAAMSIPSNTWRAASTFPFWYSSRPNKALASYKSKKTKGLLASWPGLWCYRAMWEQKIQQQTKKSQLLEVSKWHSYPNLQQGRTIFYINLGTERTCQGDKAWDYALCKEWQLKVTNVIPSSKSQPKKKKSIAH